jgi:Ca2+-binding RTX toxin-like protein
MAAYSFETITAAQALAISGTDTLSISSGTATSVTVAYLTDGSGDISITLGATTMLFGSGIAALSQIPGQLSFADGSQLFIGDGNDNVFSSGAVVAAAFGGDGSDNLVLNGPSGLLQGNAGADHLTGGQGDDTIYGGQGDDIIATGAGTNFAQGNKGNDTIVGGGVGDVLLGGQGNDNISGSGILDGNLGADTISGSGQLLGEGGDDSLSSTGGHDTLNGGDGDDTISVSGGFQSVTGGAGADTFIIGTGSTAPGSVAAITDWNGAEDKLSFVGLAPVASNFTSVSATDYNDAVFQANHLTSQNHFSFVAVQIGPDLVIFGGGSGGVTSVVDLVGRSLADFHVVQNLV